MTACLSLLLFRSKNQNFFCVLFFACSILLELLQFEVLSAREFDSEYNHFGGKKIERLKICGERCSGTNFVMYLLHANFPDVEQTALLEFGQKHFLWWFGTSLDKQKLEKLKYAPNAVDLSDSQNNLFVVVVRDPYDWLRSFYLCPRCVHRSIYEHGFFHFVSSEWKLTDVYHSLDGQYDEIDNYNPWEGRPFINVLEMRKYKLINYLTMSHLVDNYLIVRYEEVDRNPKGFIKYVSDYYNLVKRDVFIPIDTLKGSHISYVKKSIFQYRSVSSHSLMIKSIGRRSI